MRTVCTIRNVWRVGERPAAFPKVHGSVDVGIGLEATLPATKPILRWPVSFLGVPADGALPRGVARVNEDQRDSGQGSFVRDVLTQLEERPGMQSGPLFPSSPNPRANAFEVFQGNRSLRAFGGSNDLLRDAMVNVPRKAGFLTTRPGLEASSLLVLRPVPAFISRALFALWCLEQSDWWLDGS